MALGAALSSSTSAQSRSSFLPKIKLLRYANPNPSLFFLCFSTTHSPRSISNHTVVSSNLLSTSPPPLPLPFGGNWISSSSIFSSNGNGATRRRRSNDDFHGGGVVQATSETAAANPTNSLMETLKLALLFLVWYFVNIYFNLINKQLLKVYPYPLTISASQFGIGTLLILFMWTFGLYKRPNITTSQLVSILPLAIGHTLGNLFTNVSLVKVAVSFTHTIKAMEPFFTVVLSALFLGQMPTLGVVSSLVPVVGGVALASLTEASFDWVGFWSAMASNFTNQSRNVFSKKLMAKEESMDNITLFSIITIMSFILTIPVSICMEGFKFTPSYLQSAGLNVQEIFLRALLGGILYHAYQQISYMILQKVSPVSHSVSNCLKRVVVIVASVLFFQTPVSPVNCFGTAVALFGVCLYSRVKLIKPESKTT